MMLDRGLPAQPAKPTELIWPTHLNPSRSLKTDLVAFVAILRRQVWTVVTCIAASLCLAGAYLVLAPPKYTGTATVLTETSRSPSQVTNQDPQGMVDSAVVQSQMAMLSSAGLARHVIAKLKLESDPEFVAPGLASRLISMLGGSTHASPTAVSDRVLSRFKEALNITRIEQSYAVEVAFTSRDPQMSANIANAVAEAYLDDQLAARMEAARRADRWMARWVQMAQAEMNTANEKVDEFRQTTASGLAAHDPTATSELDALEKAAASKQRAYQTVRTRAERLLQFVENQSVPYTQARIVSKAHASAKPSSPKVALTVLLAGFCGGILGVAVANLREAFDRKIRLPEQMGVAARALSVVPVPWPRSSRPARGADPRALARYREQDRAAVWRLRAAVEQFASVSGAQMLAVVSPHEEDGRSVIAAALAEAIAQSGDRVLLVNAYWTDGAQVSAERAKSVSVADYSYDLLTIRLTRNGGAPPAQLRKVERELKTISDQYKYVLIDCPAILDHPQMSAAFEAVDACIIVAHVARSSLNDVRQTSDLIPFDYEQIIAVPLAA